MQIKGKADVNVQVSTKDLVSALQNEVYVRLGLPNPKQGRVFVKDNKWVQQSIAHTTHSFEVEEELRPAEEKDVEVFVAFHTIAELLRD